MALDEATAALFAAMAEQGGPPLHEMTPEEARGFGKALREMYGEGPEVSLSREFTAGSVPCRLIVPAGELEGVLVYYHGGGWVIGAIDEFDTLARKLANAAHFAVVLVDYRLAPEHPYPAAVDDAWEALTWVADHVEELVGKKLPLAIGGDSAGGNLTAVMARRAAEQGAPELLTQLLVYPVADCDFTTGSYLDPENQGLLTKEAMEYFFGFYVSDGASAEHPDISPLRAENVSGQVPALVATAEHDPLRDEGEALARKLEAAGVEVNFRRFAGQSHGFFTMVNVLPGSDAGIAFVTDHLRDQLARSTS
ncbi:MAG: alpha/beta hydrolase [Actinomycetales bacterium]